MSRIDDVVSGGTDAATNQALKPLVNSVSSQLNLSPEVAEKVVSFAAQHMVKHHLSGSPNSIDEADLARELAQKANIDPKAAAAGLKHVLKNFGR